MAAIYQVKHMIMVEPLSACQPELNKTLTELEKLHLVNKFANHFLEGRFDNVEASNPPSCGVNPRPTVFKCPDSPETDVTLDADAQQSKQHDLSENDFWGANKFLQQDDRFRFVSQYLERTGKLLRLSSTVKKTLTTHGSYEVVQSTKELLKGTKVQNKNFQITDNNVNARKECFTTTKLLPESEVSCKHVSVDSSYISGYSSVEVCDNQSSSPVGECEDSTVTVDATNIGKMKGNFHSDVMSLFNPDANHDMQMVGSDVESEFNHQSFDSTCQTRMNSDSADLAKTDFAFEHGDVMQEPLKLSGDESHLLHTHRPVFLNEDVPVLSICKQTISDVNIETKAQLTYCGVNDRTPVNDDGLNPAVLPKTFSNFSWPLPDANLDVFKNSFSSVDLNYETKSSDNKKCDFVVNPEQSCDIDFANWEYSTSTSAHQCKLCLSKTGLNESPIALPSDLSPVQTVLQGNENMHQEIQANIPVPLSSSAVPSKSTPPLLSMLLQSNTSSTSFGSMNSSHVGTSTGNNPSEQLLMANTSDKPPSVITTVTLTGNMNKEANANEVEHYQIDFAGGSEIQQTQKKVVVPKLQLDDTTFEKPTSKNYLPKPFHDRQKKPEQHSLAGNVRGKFKRPQSAGGLVDVKKNALKSSKERKCPPDSSKTSEKKPFSSLKQCRPSSASKVGEMKRLNSSPKRVWEKSSLAWSSYGRKQLRTWSSTDVIARVEKKKSDVVKSEKGQVQAGRRPPMVDQRLLASNRSKFTFTKTFASFLSPRHLVTDLPDEMLLCIFSYLPFTTLAALSSVCKRFHQLANDSTLWQTIHVHDMTLNDSWFEAMGERNPKSLTLINCCGKCVTNKGLRNFFKNCKSKLKHVHISKCVGEQLTGDVVLLHASCHCRNLHLISVPWSSTTDNGLSAISLSQPLITELNINGNSSISGESFEILTQKHAPNMMVLEMAGCFSVSVVSLMQFADRISQLTELNIGLCSKITAECVISLSAKAKMLRRLDLHGLKTITDDCLHYVVTNCKQLQVLVISQCTAVTDSGVMHIATNLQQLVRLELAGCSSVTDQGLCVLLEAAHSLEHLDISSTGATRKTVDVISRRCYQTIKTLKLSFCHNVTQASLMSLMSICFELKSLHLYGCKRINYAALIKANEGVTIEK